MEDASLPSKQMAVDEASSEVALGRQQCGSVNERATARHYSRSVW